MNEGTKILSILQVTVPPETPLTVASEIVVLELLGIVKDPQLVKSMQLAATLVPASTPATLKGLVGLLGGLVHISSKSTAAHHQSVKTILAALDALPDADLGFGSFLSICQTLLSAPDRSQTAPTAKHA